MARSFDVARRDEIVALVAEVAESVGPVDILVNNAVSASKVLNPLYIDDAEWNATLSVN